MLTKNLARSLTALTALSCQYLYAATCDYTLVNEWNSGFTSSISITNDTDQVIEGHEKPVEGLRSKPQASIVLCVGAVREGKADAWVGEFENEAQFHGVHPAASDQWASEYLDRSVAEVLI